MTEELNHKVEQHKQHEKLLKEVPKPEMLVDESDDENVHIVRRGTRQRRSNTRLVEM